MVCELVGGYNPFSYEAKSVLETFTNILNCKINWPKNMPAQLQSLLLLGVLEEVATGQTI